jgi:hypothetical protein
MMAIMAEVLGKSPRVDASRRALFERIGRREGR